MTMMTKEHDFNLLILEQHHQITKADRLQILANYCFFL